MVIDQTTLAVYAALAENVYRRDSANDQAIGLRTDLADLNVDAIAAEPDVFVTGPDFQNLGNLLTDGDYYYSERGFVGTIVQYGGKYVVVFRGTDTTLSGWESVAEAIWDQTPFLSAARKAAYRDGSGDAILIS